MSSNGDLKKCPANAARKFFDLEKQAHLVKVLDRNQKVSCDIMQVIGNTPLVKLNHIPKAEGLKCEMYAKCEFLNPGGSIKDRIAFRMVHEAEMNGRLIPGKSVIVEATSGNTGIGLSLAAAVRGYRCIIVLPEKMSNEKVNTMLALGSEIVRTPTEAASDSPESNISVARRLATEIPNAVILDQYINVDNPLAHYDGTAEEILWALDDEVDMVVIGAGTGGTVSGVGLKVKQRRPQCQIVAVDPYGSILDPVRGVGDPTVTFYEVEGIGYDFLPTTLDRSVVDKWVKTNDTDSLNMARRLIKEEGLLVGGSSGSALWGAVQAARSLKEGQKCVVVLPDNIRNYMTKFISDQWMEARDFKPVPAADELWWWENPVSEGVYRALETLPVTCSPADAIAKLTATKAPALAILDEEGSLLGIFDADVARRRFVSLAGASCSDITKFIQKKYYSVNMSSKPKLNTVSRMLDISPYVVVIEKDVTSKIVKTVGIITSEDLLQHIAAGSKKQQNGK